MKLAQLCEHGQLKRHLLEHTRRDCRTEAKARRWRGRSIDKPICMDGNHHDRCPGGRLVEINYEAARRVAKAIDDGSPFHVTDDIVDAALGIELIE